MINPQTRTDPSNRKRISRQKTFPLILLFTGVSLVGVGLFWILNPRTAGASPEGSMVQVVNNQPVHAVHEMEPLDPASIPFLTEDGPQPRISASETFFDFGSVGPNEVVQHDFLIYNDGLAPLTISRAYTTCGCTTADLSTTTIPPGKASRVTLVFDAGFHKEVAGTTVRRGLIIENNDPKKLRV